MGSGRTCRLGLTWVKPSTVKGEGGRHLGAIISPRKGHLTFPLLERSLLSHQMPLCAVQGATEGTAPAEQERQSKSSTLLLNPLRFEICPISPRSALDVTPPICVTTCLSPLKSRGFHSPHCGGAGSTAEDPVPGLLFPWFLSLLQGDHSLSQGCCFYGSCPFCRSIASLPPETEHQHCPRSCCSARGPRGAGARGERGQPDSALG